MAQTIPFCVFLDIRRRFADDALPQGSALGCITHQSCSKAVPYCKCPLRPLGLRSVFTRGRWALDVPQFVIHPACMPEAALCSAPDSGCVISSSLPPPHSTKSSLSSPSHTVGFQPKNEQTTWDFFFLLYSAFKFADNNLRPTAPRSQSHPRAFYVSQRTRGLLSKLIPNRLTPTVVVDHVWG